MMRRVIWPRVLFHSLLLAGLLASAGAAALAQTRATPAERRAVSEAALAEEVRHRLVMLPWYSVFDNITYSVRDTEVTLGGQVRSDTLKADAERAVWGIEGVTRVTNNIEILPVSPMDDQLRGALFRAIFADPQLQRYAQGVLLPIHIIVKNGHVTLEGIVARQADKDLANLRANSVSGVFSVTNNLKVESREEPRR